MVSYENLLAGGKKQLSSFLFNLKNEESTFGRVDLFIENIFTTAESRHRATVQDRLIGWKDELPLEIIRKIENIVEYFGLSDRLCAG